MRKKKLLVAAACAACAGAIPIGLSVSSASSGSAALPTATTPIQHVVVIFDENISFDHYFGTYPNATNPPGEPPLHPLSGTPSVNGLSNALLTANPNLNLPQRLGPSQAVTCDQNHGYSAEQAAFDGGLMDKFVQDTTGSDCTQTAYPNSSDYGPNGIVMDYYDGNTVTALWNLAQHFTLDDNSYDTQFGPSTPGAINLISGNTNGAVAHGGTSTAIANGTLISDQDPFYDQCSNPSTPLNGDGTPGGVTVSMTGTNVGDLMNRKGVTWGWFQGGFTPSSISNGRAICGTQHANIANALQDDYVQHHEPFQYYADTANPNHVSPSSASQVGQSDPAGTSATQAVNHQYDVSWFFKAMAAGDMPQVSFLKPPAYENGHAGNSDPLDEQRWIVDTINAIEQSPEWSSTAIMIAYDDSDGWYDHQMGPIIRQSLDVNDALNGPGKCGSLTTPPAQNDRCGVGPRLPLLVISPWAKQNYVDNSFTEQASILRFIEDNWNLGRIGNHSADASAGTLDNAFDFNPSAPRAPAVIMDDTTGEIVRTIPGAATESASTSTRNSVSATSTAIGASSAGKVSGAGQRTSYGRVKPPKLHCSDSGLGNTLILACTTSGGSRVTTLVRARLFGGRVLVANDASLVRGDRVRFTFRVGRHAHSGRYTVRLSIDAGGAVAAATHGVRIP
ncbi:MAG: alkaline phosphatase family protein [Solirubrobacterales bacterium]|nr:alkaline phosphatase family protein [Solirubrobacterales bacterium]